MKIISWNVNGIRAVERKGELEKFLKTSDPDILLLQETKSRADQLSDELTLHPEYHQFYNAAEKAGYSGTAVWAKKELFPEPSFSSEMPNFTDTEGRIVQMDWQDWSLLGVYFPNGGKSPEAWQQKLVFYDCFLAHVNTLRESGKKVIWTGDVNCAHEPIDLARPKENENKIGFLPEERAWVSRVIDQNWIDVFRHNHPEEVVYSWWHLLSGARKRNVGWRIDYFFVDKNILPRVESIRYLTEQMGSDHCPVELTLDMKE